MITFTFVGYRPSIESGYKVTTSCNVLKYTTKASASARGAKRNAYILSDAIRSFYKV